MRTTSYSLLALLFILPSLVSTLSIGPTCSRPNTTELTYRSDGAGLNEIYRALITCPNITSLDLDFVWTGCVAPSEPWSFDFRDGDRFPALQKLSLSDYDFNDNWRQKPWMRHNLGRREWASEWWQSAQRVWSKVARWSGTRILQSAHSGVTSSDRNDEICANTANVETNLDKWIRAMDFSLIQELHLAQEEKVFYERMKDQLPSLQRLSFDWGNSGERVTDGRVKFIRSVPPLESLSLTIGAPYRYADGTHNRTKFPLSTILETHGPSLQSLSLKQREGHEPTLRRPMLSVSEIDTIADSCPKLRHLGLDIDRDESTGWPNATLDALTRMSTLEFLTLRLEIGADLHKNDFGEYYWNIYGLRGPGPFREPRMSLDVAESLFEDLRRKKTGEELKKVEFVVGDFEDKPYSGPIYLPPWEEGRARMFVCESGDTAEREHRCGIHGDIDHRWPDEDYLEGSTQEVEYL